MMLKKDRVSALANVGSKSYYTRNEREFVDLETGEKKILVETIQEKKEKPKKASEPFAMITRRENCNLTYSQKSLWYTLTELINWEDNFVRNNNGTYMSISQIADVTGQSRNTISTLLNELQQKEFVNIVEVNKRTKYVYLSSQYVWYGAERNRNDNKLKELLCTIQDQEN